MSLTSQYRAARKWCIPGRKSRRCFLLVRFLPFFAGISALTTFRQGELPVQWWVPAPHWGSLVEIIITDVKWFDVIEYDIEKGNSKGRSWTHENRNYFRFTTGRIDPITTGWFLEPNILQRLSSLLRVSSFATAFCWCSCAFLRLPSCARLSPPFHRADPRNDEPLHSPRAPFANNYNRRKMI